MCSPISSGLFSGEGLFCEPSAVSMGSTQTMGVWPEEGALGGPPIAAPVAGKIDTTRCSLENQTQGHAEDKSSSSSLCRGIGREI